MSSYEPPQLYDLVDPAEMSYLHENRFIRHQVHPSEPLSIINYTDKAQVNPKVFADYPSLNQCRGLIFNTDDGTVVARPFPKFWNYGQPGAAAIEPNQGVIVTDKVDGSLGILYREPRAGRLAIATRGSFTSDQAVHATKVLRERYETFRPAPGDTLLFEIVYPANRIVLDYDGLDDLVLLGEVDIKRGFVNGPEPTARYHGWRGPLARSLPYKTLAAALAAPPRLNAEGMVIRQPHWDGDRLVKLKQEDYVALHRIVTGLNERTVWEHLKAGKNIWALVEPLPDEFHPWVLKVAHRLNEAFERMQDEIDYRYLDYVREIGNWFIENQDVDKRQMAKKFAEIVKDDPQPWAMFATRQGKDVDSKLWELLKPEPGKNPSNTPLEG